jgi:hypothetical protein
MTELNVSNNGTDPYQVLPDLLHSEHNILLNTETWMSNKEMLRQTQGKDSAQNKRPRLFQNVSTGSS